MNLTKTRDASIIGGFIIGGLAIAALAFDEIVGPLLRQPAVKPDEMLLGDNFNLYSVVSGLGDGKGRSTYVRPATPEEEKSSEAASEIDGVGVFGVNDDGQHVLPGSPEWAQALGGYSFRLSYYRVG